ncbi:hypothetical protein SAMN04487773_1234 [Enterobacter sp. kpr-6]|nr:hypothetical protein SAMN04487773_1234 [Enterobacter sp. kpr-6]
MGGGEEVLPLTPALSLREREKGKSAPGLYSLPKLGLSPLPQGEG